MTSYTELYERCLSRIEDYSLVVIPEEDMEHMLHNWLTKAITKMIRCESDLSQRDDEAKTFLIDLTELDKEVLTIFMTNEWLTPQINSILLTKQFIGGKEEKLSSQSRHLAQLQALRDANRSEAKKLLCEYSYRSTNDYFKT